MPKRTRRTQRKRPTVAALDRRVLRCERALGIVGKPRVGFEVEARGDLVPQADEDEPTPEEIP